MDTATQVQNLDEAVCISYSANVFVKSMNLSIPPPALTLVRQSVYNENSKFKPVKLCLRNRPCVTSCL